MARQVESVATEADYQRTVVEAAGIGGWLVHHARPARTAAGWRTAITGTPGFPDLVLAHPDGRLLVVELKRRPNRPTADQLRWLEVLSAAGVDARLVYVPDQLDALVAELVDARQPAEVYAAVGPDALTAPSAAPRRLPVAPVPDRYRRRGLR